MAWSSKEDQSKDRQNGLAILAQAGDEKAMAELIRITLPIAISQARKVKFASYSIAAPTGAYSDVYDELRQEAMLGLVEAVHLYDPHRGVKFWTFAYYRVKKRISLWLAHNSGSVSMPHEAWRTAKAVDEAEDEAGAELSASQLTEITGKGYARTAVNARAGSVPVEPEYIIEPAFTDIPLDEVVLGFVLELEDYETEAERNYAIEEFCEEYELSDTVFENLKEVANENSTRSRKDDGRSVANRRRRTKEPRNSRG